MNPTICKKYPILLIRSNISAENQEIRALTLSGNEANRISYVASGGFPSLGETIAIANFEISGIAAGTVLVIYYDSTGRHYYDRNVPINGWWLHP
jgi:hypothetical protein